MSTFNFTADTDFYKRNFTFVNGSNYGYKSGGTNGTFDAFAMSKKICNQLSSDQSVRWLIKNYSQLVAFGWGQYPTPDYTQLPFCFYVEATNGNLRVYEFGVLKITQTNVINENSELRIQIDLNAGSYRCRYWRRDGVGQSENLVYTSTMTSAQIQALFPLCFLCCLAGYNAGTPTNSAAFEVADIEADADKVVTIGESLGNVAAQDVINFNQPLDVKSGAVAGGVKELPNHQLTYSGENIPTARNGLLTFKAMKDWKAIKSIRLSFFNALTYATEFNIRKNNTNLFTTELTIPANQKEVNIPLLNILTADTDEFIFDYKTVGKTISAPIILELEIESNT